MMALLAVKAAVSGTLLRRTEAAAVDLAVVGVAAYAATGEARKLLRKK